MSEEKSLVTEILSDQQRQMDCMIDELDSTYRQMKIIRKVSRLEASDAEDAAEIDEIYDAVFESDRNHTDYKAAINALTNRLDDDSDGKFLSQIYALIRRHIERKETKGKDTTTE